MLRGSRASKDLTGRVSDAGSSDAPEATTLPASFCADRIDSRLFSAITMASAAIIQKTKPTQNVGDEILRFIRSFLS